MRYTHRQYAQALYEAVKGKSAGGTSEVIDRFFAELEKNCDLALAGKIVKTFEAYAREKEGELAGELVCARPLDGKVREGIENKIKKIMAESGRPARRVDFQEKIDAGLIGGCRARAGEIFIDISVKGALQRMKRQLQASL